MSDRRGLLANDRGQTLQDYALGISLFLLTVFFVIGLIVPSLLAPFQTDAGGDNEAQADRVATALVQNASDSGRLNELNVSIVESVVGKSTDDLREQYHIPSTSWVNISLWTLNGSDIVTSTSGTDLMTAESPEGGESATSARIVTLSDQSCDTACRLVVRVW